MKEKVYRVHQHGRENRARNFDVTKESQKSVLRNGLEVYSEMAEKCSQKWLLQFSDFFPLPPGSECHQFDFPVKTPLLYYNITDLYLSSGISCGCVILPKNSMECWSDW